jgi:hypothetical protein
MPPWVPEVFGDLQVTLPESFVPVSLLFGTVQLILIDLAEAAEGPTRAPATSIDETARPTILRLIDM